MKKKFHGIRSVIQEQSDEKQLPFKENTQINSCLIELVSSLCSKEDERTILASLTSVHCKVRLSFSH